MSSNFSHKEWARNERAIGETTTSGCTVRGAIHGGQIPRQARLHVNFCNSSKLPPSGLIDGNTVRGMDSLHAAGRLDGFGPTAVEIWRSADIGAQLGLLSSRNLPGRQSLQVDTGPIGPKAPSGVPMQDAPSGYLADADPTLVVAPIPLSPRTPHTCYVPGFRHGHVELVCLPGHPEIIDIGAHLASDDASLALSTTTGGSGLLPGLPRANPIIIGHVLAQRTISLAFFGIWFLACVLALLTTSKRSRLANIKSTLASLNTLQICGDVHALQPVMLPCPLAYHLAVSSGRDGGRTFTPGPSTAATGSRVSKQATRNSGFPSIDAR
ncbi:hypothetical protein C8R44DRAFT_751470 [Mycena epipterygia]|nr:hypothetical protein C8R44DRAFT_751470 [Mycena epipterygia]